MPKNLDKANFYAILDTGYVEPESWRDTYRSLLDGGADLIQIRAKGINSQRRQLLVDTLLPDFATSGVPLIINDDLEVAGAYPGIQIGLHLGQEDCPPALAREKLGPDRIIGLSTHSLEQAETACHLGRRGVIDYFAVGPVFATPTKPDYEPVGLGLALEVQAMNPPVPFFCIGGITRETLPRILAAGLSRVVVVSDVLKDPEPAEVVAEYKRQLSA